MCPIADLLVGSILKASIKIPHHHVITHSQATNSVPDHQAEPPTTEDDPVNDVPKNVPNDAEDFGSSDEDFDADSGQEMRTTLTNDPGSLYSSLGDLPLITPMEESHDDSDSDSEASDISSSVSLTPSARLLLQAARARNQDLRNQAESLGIRTDNNAAGHHNQAEGSSSTSTATIVPLHLEKQTPRAEQASQVLHTNRPATPAKFEGTPPALSAFII